MITERSLYASVCVLTFYLLNWLTYFVETWHAHYPFGNRSVRLDFLSLS
jgi:hypothetical protein